MHLWAGLRLRYPPVRLRPAEGVTAPGPTQTTLGGGTPDNSTS